MASFAAWLLSGARRPPETMLTFCFIFLITGKPAKLVNETSQRYALSFTEDRCYAVTNGDWVMPKYLTLPMAVRHLTGSTEVITILNRYGQSYTPRHLNFIQPCATQLFRQFCHKISRDTIILCSICAMTTSILMEKHHQALQPLILLMVLSYKRFLIQIGNQFEPTWTLLPNQGKCL